MSSEPFDWRDEERLAEAEAARRAVEATARQITALERELRIQEGARAECEAEVRALEEQKLALRRLPRVQYTDEAGFEQVGASPEAQREYFRLQDAIAAREATHQRWREARPQYPTSAAWWLGRLRVALAVGQGELRAVIEELPPGLRLRFEPAPDYTDHVARTAELRAGSAWRTPT